MKGKDTNQTSNFEENKNEKIQEEIADSTESIEDTLLYKTTLAPTHFKIT